MIIKKIIQEGGNNIYVETNNGVINIYSKKEIPKYLCSLPSIIENEVIGRQDDINDLKEKLKKSNEVVLVNGLGGIGKTTVAKLFITQILNSKEENSFNHFAWIDVSKGVKEAFVFNHQLVDSLNLDIDKEIEDDDSINYSFGEITKRMKNLKGKNLLIIDNVGKDAESRTILNAINLKPYWRVLVTSRQKLKGYMIHDLDFLSKDDAKKLYLLHYKRSYNETDLEELLELIGRHTLTIELLAKTLQNNYGLSGIKDLIKYLKNRQLDAEDLRIVVNISHSDEEVMIYSHLMKAFRLANLDEDEKKILLYFSIIPAKDTNVEDLMSIFKIKNTTNFSNKLNSLVEKGWVIESEPSREENTPSFRCHQIIQEIVRYKLSPNSENCKDVVDYFAEFFFVKVGKNPLKKKRFLTFGETILSLIKDESENIGALNDNLAKTLRYFGYNDKAINYAKEGIVIREKVLPPHHKDIGNSYVNTAVIFRYLKQYNKALDYGLKALDFFLALPKKNYISIATAYYKITLTYIQLRNYKKAMEYSILDLETLNKAKELEQMTKAQEVYFAETYNTRGEILRKMNDFESALQYKLNAIKIREDKLEENHPDLAISYHHTAITYFEIQNYKQAEVYIDKALLIRQLILPEDHTDLIESLEWKDRIKDKLKQK